MDSVKYWHISGCKLLHLQKSKGGKNFKQQCMQDGPGSLFTLLIQCRTVALLLHCIFLLVKCRGRMVGVKVELDVDVAKNIKLVLIILGNYHKLWSTTAV